MKSVKYQLLCSVTAVAAMAVAGFSALPDLETPAANVTETWKTSNNNWGLKDGYSPAKPPASCWTTNMLLVTVNAVTNTTPRLDQLAGGTNASGARFVGNYALKKIASADFDVKVSGLTSNPEFMFKYTKAGMTNSAWIYRTAAIPADTAGQWVHVSIPMAFSTLWVNGDYAWGSGPTPIEAASVFETDKANIVGLEIQVSSPKLIPSSETFAISNLKLVGPWSGPFTSNGVSVAWLQENGLNLEDAFKDTDNDGQFNDVEFLACTDPANSNDVFRVELGLNADGRPVLKWKENNRYAKYDLLEGTDLNDPKTFKGKSGFENMPGSGTERQADVDPAAVTGPRFYKIQVKAQ